jgi:hypothetical protein
MKIYPINGQISLFGISAFCFLISALLQSDVRAQACQGKVNALVTALNVF